MKYFALSKGFALISECVRWAVLGLVFLVYVAMECAAIYYIYKALGVT